MKRFPYSTLQQRVWRWHFFAGLMVVPFAIILSVTGAIYLFKPQFENYVDQQVNSRAQSTLSDRALSADALVELATERFSGSSFKSITLAGQEDRTVEIELSTDEGKRMVWVDQYSGEILFDMLKQDRFMRLVQNIHGNLLAGKIGSYIVEGMASWMIVLLTTGIFIWWPRADEKNSTKQSALRRTLRPPPFAQKGRSFWFRLHGVFGFWLSLFIMILLLSGLPWTQLWGSGFKEVQSLMGWDGPGQEWKITLTSAPVDEHAEHRSPPDQQKNIKNSAELWEINPSDDIEVALKSSDNTERRPAISLQKIVDKANALALPPPNIIYPPKGEDGVWTLRSMIQNRPLRSTHHYDRWSGEKIMEVNFSDYHPVKKVVSYGLAIHEGQLFGWFNQLLGLVTALGVILLSASGFYMWWIRKPTASLGAPKLPKSRALGTGLIVSVIGLAAFLPALAISLGVILAVEVAGNMLRKFSPTLISDDEKAL